MMIKRCTSRDLKICETCHRNIENTPGELCPPFLPDVREGGRCMDWLAMPSRVVHVDEEDE